MRKLLLLTAIVVLGCTNLNAQEFKIGASAALPTGDFSDFVSFGVNIDAAYLWEVADNITVGPKTGLIYGFGKKLTILGSEITLDDTAFLPIAATGRILLAESFLLGADLGYGIGISPSGNNGGFYYRPMAGYAVSEAITIMLSYTGISLTGGTFNTVNAGVEFGL